MMDIFWQDQWWKFLGIWIPLLAAWFNLKTEIKANRNASIEMFNLQEKKNDARTNIPVVIELLDDLADLQQAFIFRGRFIPGLEHRSPRIQFHDSGTEGQLSVAERIHQLRLISRRMLTNCRKVIFLMPKNIMPETVEVCRSIRDAWSSKEQGKKFAYEIKINAIGSLLQNDCDRPGVSEESQQNYRQSRQKITDNDEKSCAETAEELCKFHSLLESCVEKEFPTFAFESSRKKSS